ncbi:MAG: 1-hydroxycarotenoid 3,4-desaturase CrtD [Burkholderiaceae bacterium]|jgi:1-hydroxycarotenoid 3,4-desaturase
MSARSVLIVGAGMGGLAAAVDLARQGVQVTVLEAHAKPGGKIHQRQAGSKWIDSGPTVITMSWVFEDLLAAAGLRLSDVVTLSPLPILARHAWSAAEWLDLYADPKASEQAIAEFSGGAAAAQFQRFMAETRALYFQMEQAYMRSSRPSLMSMGSALGPRGLALLATIGPMQSLWTSLGRHFQDPRLRQLFARYATYCGGSPWQAPATLSLIAFVETCGVWRAEGGMQALGEGMAKAAQGLGAEIRTGQPVARILVEGGRAMGVETAQGEVLRADAVVFNGDAAALRDGLLGEAVKASVQPTGVLPRSLSAMTWAVDAKLHGRPLDHHNVFFQPDYEREFTDVFDHQQLPATPTIYICAQDRGAHMPDHGQAERLLMLINAPAIGDRPSAFPEQTIDQTFARLQRQLAACGVELETQPETTTCTTPSHFHQQFPATGGALYGRAPHGWMSVFQRPSAQTPIPGLFLAGGSAHPGAGVPMAALSGRLAAATLMAHLDSTRRSARVVISGGMSMA